MQSGDGGMKWWGRNLQSALGLLVNLKTRNEKSEEGYHERPYKKNPDTPIE